MARNEISLRAPAKINPYLRVVGRRSDGYHLLATLMQKLALFDRVDIQKGCSGITMECPDSDLPVTSDNIAFRAALMYFEKMGDTLPEDQGVHITLKKNIPIAAGLGGGSSDAAAVLIGLDTLFQTGCSRRSLAEMGLQLGADVPLFIHDWPVAWATGIGEQLEPAPGVGKCKVLLVNPGFSVSTKWVYEKLSLTLGEKISNLSNSHSDQSDFAVESSLAEQCINSDQVYNDLEQVTISSYKIIGLIKKQLLAAGAACALMSGSGPTVFGIFPQSMLVQAEECYRQMLQSYNNTFLVDPLQEGQDRFINTL